MNLAQEVTFLICFLEIVSSILKNIWDYGENFHGFPQSLQGKSWGLFRIRSLRLPPYCKGWQRLISNDNDAKYIIVTLCSLTTDAAVQWPDYMYISVTTVLNKTPFAIFHIFYYIFRPPPSSAVYTLVTIVALSPGMPRVSVLLFLILITLKSVKVHKTPDSLSVGDDFCNI